MSAAWFHIYAQACSLPGYSDCDSKQPAACHAHVPKKRTLLSSPWLGLSGRSRKAVLQPLT